MESSTMSRYSNIQIALHWAVAGMIVVQWATSGAIPRTHDPLLPATKTDMFLHMVHNYNGMAIALLVLLRVGLRLSNRRVASRRPANRVEAAAVVVHYGIYACLAAQAGTGFLASYLWSPAAEVHKMIWNVTLSLAAIHLAAALGHAVRRDGVLSRMLPSRRSAEGYRRTGPDRG
ncbi:cytochrome B [Aquibium carbonis]|uniref:Cytochrome B n=2 Tax=Aquibium carbonis TaxID=2495581 RepID=A0A3S0G281_9HYPH|nr:cytochrome B [Aquibium carbonis]